MICLGAKTDQEVKERVTCGPHTNKKKKKKNKNRRNGESSRGRGKVFYFFNFFFSLASLFYIRKSDRQNSSGEEAKCSTQ